MANDIPNRLLYSYAQFRALMGDLPASTLDKWIVDGIVTPVRIGPRRRFIRHEDVVRLIESSTLPKVG